MERYPSGPSEEDLQLIQQDAKYYTGGGTLEHVVTEYVIRAMRGSWGFTYWTTWKWKRQIQEFVDKKARQDLAEKGLHLGADCSLLQDGDVAYVLSFKWRGLQQPLQKMRFSHKVGMQNYHPAGKCVEEAWPLNVPRLDLRQEGRGAVGCGPCPHPEGVCSK